MLKVALITACLVLTRAKTPEELCDASLPNLSVGDAHLTDKNYMKFKKKHKLFVLGTSDSTCDKKKGVCCHSETVLSMLHK